ncbi:unnamed protein product [Phytophthora lilii]|uniref:Unnamed protein product n=1 Tax=Phytophthora lilii TaxID=2077276 RepID=A0A9W6YJL5_9STRA|nr:unnamed protein product [Phytophthora lilii]
MSTFASYRSVNKGCAPNTKLHSPVMQRSGIAQVDLLKAERNPKQRSDLKQSPHFSNDKRVTRNVDVVKSVGRERSLMAVGTLAALGAASYGLLRNHWERNSLVQDFKTQEHTKYEARERQRKERELLENVRLFKMAVTGVLAAIAVLALLYIGWFYLLLAVVIVLSLFLCALS